METYTVLRSFADSWFLVAMVLFFLGTWVFAFWPSLKPHREDAADIPLRDDTLKDASPDTDSLKGPDHG